MEKRAVIAVILSIAVFYAFSFFFPQPKKPSGDKPVQVQLSSASLASASGVAAVALPAPPAGAVTEKDVVVETPLFSATFSSRGGELKRFVLRKYSEKAGNNGDIVLFDAGSRKIGSLGTTGSGIPVEPTALYAPSTDAVRIDAGGKGEVTFAHSTPQGVVVAKKYSFSGDSYDFRLETTISNGTSAPISGPVKLDLLYRLESVETASRFETQGPVAYVDGKLVSETPKDNAIKPLNLEKGAQWAGLTDKYFLQVAVAETGAFSTGRFESAPDKHIKTSVVLGNVAIAPGAAATLPVKLYFGPKDLELLKSQGHNLEHAIDLGWFAALAKPLLHTLKFFYGYTHNYGIAIIIITVILKVLFYPLTYKSYKSMKEMQKLQPKMTQLKEKFKNDREKMNMEVMKLYQEHKVNPLGGCLPMIVQIPVFFALYKALMFSIELRHAPFMLWINDLAGKDPYYVTPIIMGITMVIQQKMTPSQMDPIQQKMMMALPIVFTFMFLNFPSGLVLYWLVNNVLTIGQQYYINRKLD